MPCPARAPAGGRRGTLAAAALAIAAAAPSAAAALPRFPDVVLISVDTLRADHLSSAGYARQTTPHLDRLLAPGFRFTRARTVEPLTNPAMTSVLTSLPPHLHGATRNGLPVRPGLPSLPSLLARRGYRTAAIVGNWTLKERLSGLAEHWQSYEVVVSRKRWLGLLKDEARAADLTDAALGWAAGLRDREPRRPFLLWVHYVEPHAPYRLHREQASRLGIEPRRANERDRYDTEIAATDAEIGRLVAGLDELPGGRERLLVFLADHGEAFGEDGEFGHGRTLHEPALRVPLAFVWPGRIGAGQSDLGVSLLDVAPTVLALLGLPAHPRFRGADLVPALAGRELALAPVCLQAHRGAVQSVQSAERARRAGLLEVGVLDDGRVETSRVARSPREEAAAAVSPALEACRAEIRAGLAEADRAVPPELDAESAEELRALGYLD